MGQSRKARLRGNDKTWKPPVGIVVKLKLTQSLHVYRKMIVRITFRHGHKNVSEARFIILVDKFKVVIFHR